jgi:hypothetical protein
MREKADQAAVCASAHRLSSSPGSLGSVVHGEWSNQREPAMSRFVESHFHSAPVRAEMRALDLRTRRLPFGTMLVSVIAGANTLSVIAMLLGM